MHDMDHEVGKSYRFFPTSAVFRSTSSEHISSELFTNPEFPDFLISRTSSLLSPARH